MLLHRHRPARSVLLAFIAVTITSLHSGGVAAEPSAAEREIARSAMQAGDELRAAGDLRAALLRYRSAHTIMRVPTTGLAVASTEAELGLLVEARSTAIEVLNLPGEGSESAVFGKARADASELALELEPRVPSIIVDVAPRNAPFAVSIDGVALPRDARDLPLKSNPGVHVVEVRASGYLTRAQDVTIAEGQTLRLPFLLEAAARAPVVSATEQGVQPGIVATSLAAAPAFEAGRTRAMIGLTAGGAILVAGACAGIVSLVSTERQKGRCDEQYCGPNSRGALSTANTLANVANVAIPVGLIGIAYAFYELFTLKSSGDRSKDKMARWNIDGATLRGSL